MLTTTRLSIADLRDWAKGPLPLKMHASDATAVPLFAWGRFGADAIRFPAGGRVPDHTHPGAHILYVLSGTGWVDYEGEPTRLEPGVCYLIPGGARHGIRADTELTLLAVASDHRPADSPERLRVTAERTPHPR